MTDLAKAYFRWHKSRTDGDLWARDRVEEIFLRDTEEGWLLTLDLMAEAPLSIPAENDHQIRRKSISRSERNRSSIPGKSITCQGQIKTES